MKARRENKVKKPDGAQQGFSLVELMVALLIGLILTTGVIQIFLGSKQAYRLNEGVSRVQENIRFSMETMQRDIRMAGYAGCTKNITNWLNQGGAGFVDAVLAGTPIMGWEFSGTGIGDTYAVGTPGSWTNGTADPVPAGVASQALQGSDLLLVNRATRLECVITGQPNLSAANLQTSMPCGLNTGAIVIAVTENCSGGDMFQPQTAGTGASTLSRGVGGSPGNTAPANTPFGNTYGSGGFILDYESVAYFIGTGDSGEPALFQARVTPGGALAADSVSELVESVESMQILFGIDENGDKHIDRYITASSVNDWDEVLSVRLSLLVRSAAEVNTQLDTRTYTLLGAIIDPVDDRRIRQVSTTTIGIRNRLD